MSESAVKDLLNEGAELKLDSGKIIKIKKFSFMKNMRDGLMIVKNFAEQGIDFENDLSVLAGLSSLMLEKEDLVFNLIKASCGLAPKDIEKLEKEDLMAGPKIIRAVFEENKDFLSQAMNILTGS